MRRFLLFAALLPGLACSASAGEEDVLRRIEEVLRALAGVEERVAGIGARLDRIEGRLAEVEAWLQRVDEALRSPPGAVPPTDPGPGGGEGGGEASGPGDATPGVEVTGVLVRNRRLVVRPDTGDEYLVFEVEATVRNLRRAARIKARFHLTDRFDEPKRWIDWTTTTLRPGDKIIDRNVQFRVTRSAPEDLWLRSADLREIRGRFEVQDVLYGVDIQDGPATR